MNNFVALDFETANRYMSSVCSIRLVFVEKRRQYATPFRGSAHCNQFLYHSQITKSAAKAKATQKNQNGKFGF